MGFRPRLELPFHIFGFRQTVQEKLKEVTRPLRILYVSSYIPRKCGIATFTKDLTNGINLLNPHCLAEIAVVTDQANEKLPYPPEAKFLIREDHWVDYRKVAREINNSDYYQLVCIQHEYGIYGKNDGELVVRFAQTINKPIVTTFHTVLPQPSPRQKKIVESLAQKSIYSVVMLNRGAELLSSVYQIPPKKLVVIPHGVPDFPKLETSEWKKQHNLEKKIVMSSINLLSENKGIEYAIESVPMIIQKIPNFIYMLIGQTHPKVLEANQGRDPYRDKLERLVKDLKVKKHVKFINRYVSLKEVISFIGASDFYVTPYLDPQQITSGSLAYAIGAGKVCISTPYLYAQELLGEGRGVLVPFRDPQAIAKAVIRLAKNPSERRQIERKAYAIGRTMTWVNVGAQYLYLFNFAIQKFGRAFGLRS